MQKTISTFEALNTELENYFRNTIIPQMFIDRDLILRKFTPPAMKQFSLKTTDIGKAVQELSGNIRFPGIIDNIRHVVASGDILEKEIQTTDMRWYQMNILPYIDFSTGKANGVIITFIDITARIKDLKDLERLIADHQILIDTISHDIKTPLTNITLALDMIGDSTSEPGDTATAIEIIGRSAKRIQSMIEELNNLPDESSIETANAELLSFENILEDACIALTTQLSDAKATIKKDIQAPEISFSRRKLRSVVYNLISNAVKYRSPERVCEILISTSETVNEVEIAVKDNSIGIDQDKQDAIFTKYYRIQSNVEGTGVGLYLIREIVHNAGGTISVESMPGDGSVFTVRLPKTSPQKKERMLSGIVGTGF
jgi:two-component system, OmpR family, phosphate regulon sensor histidine kinase PhoR